MCRPITVGHVIALFTEALERRVTTEVVSNPKTTGTKRRKSLGGKVVRGITRDLTAYLADYKGQVVTVDMASKALRHYTRRQIANTLYLISRKGDVENVGRGKYQVHE